MKIYNVTKSYDNFRLDLQRLEMRKGVIHGLIGSNGCGKTTAIKIMAGVTAPDSGSIDYEGLSARDITMIMRKPYLLHGTVTQNLIYPLTLRKIKPGKDVIEHHLEITNLKEYRNSNALGLSSGQQQKLALARALIFSPKLILADEAFANMDIEGLAFFEDYILKRQEAHQTTWLIAGHQLSIIKRLCGYVYFMHDGRIQCEGPVGDMLDNPTDEILKKYLYYV
jgi:ABC-type multidrug transport system ATPase subunit